MNRPIQAALTVLSILFYFVATHAAGDRRAPSPLDARVLHRAGAAISVLPLPLESLSSSDDLRSAWEEFRLRNGSAWTVYLDERSGLPTLLSGPGIPFVPEAGAAEATLDDLDTIARRFLAENVARLGAWSDLLELDRAASLELREGHVQLVYRQRVDGVRVENARLDLHVVRGRMVLMGAHLWTRPRVGGSPALDAASARRRLDSFLGGDASRLVPAGEPELILLPAAAESDARESRGWSGPRGAGIRHVLVWRFRFDESGTPTSWVGEVDARDGSIVAFYEGSLNAAVRGGVFPRSPDGDCVEGGCEIAGFPMPFADTTESGQAETYADAYGNLMCLDPGATFETTLSGPYVHVADACGTTSEIGACDSGADLGVKAGENCTVQPGASPGNTAAARTTFYHVNRIAELARFYHADNAWLRSPLTVNVNLSSSCNANWSGSVINMYGAGGNCNNTGENADILVHEWGHGYDQNDGGGMDRPSEAYSDIVAILTSRDSCMGRGMYNDGSTCTGYGDTCLTCTGFREFDWTKRESNTPATPSNFARVYCPTDTTNFSGPCRREPHCESYVSSEAMYDLATRDLPATGMDAASAWQLVERLWYVTRPGSGGDAYTCLSTLSNSCGSTSWYQRMRVADDDDGNLANGTPHSAALFAAFRRHDIACGAATDATNQSTSSCPSLPTPVLSRTMTPAGVELSWTAVPGAAETRVYRGELGCNRQQVPIASLPAGQTTFVDDSADSEILRHYRVEAFAANRACFSRVSNCVGAPPGSRIQMASHRVEDGEDGVPEPGETFDLPVSLFNAGADPALSVAAALRAVAPGNVRVLRPGASWPTFDPGTTAENLPPHHQVVVLEEAACGEELVLAFDATAANSGPLSSEIRIPMGTPFRDYPETAIVPIPYVTAAPVEVYWNVADARTIADLDVTLDIFHQAPTQLVVELVSPSGTRVRLHDRTGGNGYGIQNRFDRDRVPDGPGTMADFAGEPLNGLWTLSVQDVDGSGVTTDGYIRPRTLHATIVGGFGCEPRPCGEPKPTAAPDLRVNRVDAGARIDLAFDWSAVAGAGYHVLESADPSFGSTVELLGTTTTETSFTLEDGANTTPAVTFFEVRAVNACHQEGP